MTQTTKLHAEKVRTTKKRATNKKSLIFKILALLISVMAIFEILAANTQVFVTEVQLGYINMCFTDYNSSNYETASMETMQKMEEKRQELYSSNDPIVWIAANVPTLIKVIFLILSIAIYGIIILMVISYIISVIERIRKKS